MRGREMAAHGQPFRATGAEGDGSAPWDAQDAHVAPPAPRSISTRDEGLEIRTSCSHPRRGLSMTSGRGKSAWRNPRGCRFDRSSQPPEARKRTSVPTMPLSDVPCRASRRRPVQGVLGFASADRGLACARRVALFLAVCTALLPCPTVSSSTFSTAMVGRKRGQGESSAKGGTGVSAVSRSLLGFECTTCGNAFSQSGSLAVHMRSHSGDRPYACATCGKAFSTSGNLASHRKKMHTPDPE